MGGSAALSFSHRLEGNPALSPIFNGKQRTTFFFKGRETTILLRVIFDGVASRVLVQDWVMKLAEGRV